MPILINVDIYLFSQYIYRLQGVSVFRVHILTTCGGMKTTLYGNFNLCKFKFCKKLQRFEFICEKTIFAVRVPEHGHTNGKVEYHA